MLVLSAVLALMFVLQVQFLFNNKRHNKTKRFKASQKGSLFCFNSLLCNNSKTDSLVGYFYNKQIISVDYKLGVVVYDIKVMYIGFISYYGDLMLFFWGNLRLLVFIDNIKQNDAKIECQLLHRYLWCA